LALQFRIAFSGTFLSLFQKKYCLFQQGVLEERCKLSSGVRGEVSEANAFLGLFYIASNAVKNIIWLINL